jgi:hemerythrin-like metal-binding protein
MALLTWNHACTVGVMAMDDQHGILMDTLNELRLAVVRGSNRDEVNELMSRLIEFTRMHFWSEEQLMEKFSFPGFVEHRDEHHHLLSQIQDSARRMQHGEAVHMRPLLGFLRDCYQEHMSGLDQDYGSWLNDRGVL